MTGRLLRCLCALIPLGLMVASALGAMQAPQEPAGKPKQEGPLPTKPEQPYDPTTFLEGLKPLPLEPIPDDPPPHEGAMFQLSYRIESPDLVLVEVLEALPGRPIQGERLVRPDGTLSLQWYGELHVDGLTIDQVKVKVILHLRQFMTDETLGLIAWDPTGREMAKTSSKDGPKRPLHPLDALPEWPPEDAPVLPIPTSSPLPFIPTDPFHVPSVLGPLQPITNLPGPRPTATKTTEQITAAAPRAQSATPTTKESTSPAKQYFPDAKKSRPLVEPLQTGVGNRDGVENPAVPNAPAPSRTGNEGKYVYVFPSASDRVFVDVSAYNSKVYYVQGDVASPGRLSCTGKETVLDAINFAGGFLASADDASIRLFRPARGNQRAREYPINYRAILRGDHKANLQMFPGDRLVVPRRGQT
jgi:protein involved in polysaccharide export with SLBB domain